MTYLAGLGFPGASREPTLRCDECGNEMIVRPTRGGMPAWLRDKRAPKGWKRLPQPGDMPAHHACPLCLAEASPDSRGREKAAT